MKSTAVSRHVLPCEGPFDASAFAGFLRAYLVSGVEALEDGIYSRRVDEGRVEIDLRGGSDGIPVSLAGPESAHARDLDRVRSFLGLDVDAAAVAEALAGDPVIGPLVAARPGLRVPGSLDHFQTAVFAVLGQQVSLAAARTLDARFVAAFGNAFPSPARAAGVDPEQLSATLRVPRMRGRAIVGLAAAFARIAEETGNGTAPLADVPADEVRRRLLAVPGVGPWTVDYVLLRAQGDPDAFVPGDLVLRRALAARVGRDRLGPREAEAIAASWRPYRAHALMQLWTAEAYDA